MCCVILCTVEGLLPRPDGEWKDKPLPTPPWNYSKMNQWSTKKALFGQNDYIGLVSKHHTLEHAFFILVTIVRF